MATRQDELRRLMKESKGKAQSAQSDKRASAAKSAGDSTTTAVSTTSTGKDQSKSDSSASAGSSKAVPAGFFDDSIADAKARNVDVKQLAEAQLTQDWEQFQEFVAEVEQQDVKDSELQKEETKEKEAVEQLETMQYVDRYRIALERAAKLGATKKKGLKKRGTEEPEAAAVNGISGDANADDEDAVANAVQNHMKKLKMTKNQKQKKKKAESSEDDDDEAFDPCNWRSKAF